MPLIPAVVLLSIGVLYAVRAARAGGSGDPGQV